MITSIFKITLISILLFPSLVIAGDNAINNCTIDLEETTKQFNILLFKNKNHKSAMNYLRSKKPCVSNKYEAAYITDLSGEIMRYGYIKLKDHDLFIKAKDLYKKALSFKTKHDAVILRHLSMLMWEKGDYRSGMKYIDQALLKKPKDVVPYFSTALMLSVKVKHWKQAKAIVNILTKRKKDYYLSIPLLSATVQTLCHYKKSKIANNLINTVQKYRPKLNKSENIMFKKTKMVAANCT